MQCLQVWCSPSVRCGCKWCSINILPVFYRGLVKWVCRCTFYAKLNPFTLCNNATHPPNKSLLKNIVTGNGIKLETFFGNVKSFYFSITRKILGVVSPSELTWYAVSNIYIYSVSCRWIYIYDFVNKMKFNVY